MKNFANVKKVDAADKSLKAIAKEELSNTDGGLAIDFKKILFPIPMGYAPTH